MRSTQRPATAGATASATDLPALPASPSLAIARSICLQPVCARPYQTSGPGWPGAGAGSTAACRKRAALWGIAEDH